MSIYEQAVQDELARQRAAYEKAQAAGDMTATPPDETAIRAMYSFLAEQEPMPAPAAAPDFSRLVYKAGAKYWSVAEASFMAEPEDKGRIVELAPGTDAYLRKTLEFYSLPVGDELLSASELTARKREAIDAETSTAILSGFDYEVNGETLHFSYDSFDQQNFADTANACLMQKAGAPGLPETVTWNAYRHGSGELIRLIFTADEFLALYAGGALNHKARCMELGGVRKAELAAQGANA